MFNSDLTANRPAAGIVGRIFIAIDSPFGIFRDTGSAWDQISAGGSGGITGSGAATQVAFWNGTSSITGSNNLFWDSINNYLGINTNVPTTALDVHHSTNSGAIFNQTTATNNNTINFQTTGAGRWRIGNFYTAGADDFGVFDVVGALQQFTIVNTTGQTFVGAKITASGRFVINSATADAHLQIVGANAPSIRIDNAGSGGTQRFAIGNATATDNFIQGSAAGDFCITTASAGPLLFGMWQTIDAIEVFRISTTNNLQIGSASALAYTSKLQLTGDAYFTGVFRETITTNTQVASYSLVLSDNGKLILMNVATANNLTIPLNSSINFPVGTKIDVSSIGAGQTTIVAAGGVTINSAGGALKLRLQYSGATLVQTATNVWSLFGDITT
jgi:hypothetical protein